MFQKSFAVGALMAATASFAPLPSAAADTGAEITTAATHAGLAAEATDIATVHAHLHHTVNCLAGPGGTGFDAKELNPCANQGSGAIPDSTSASTKHVLQAALASAESGITATDLAAAQKAASATEATLKTAK